MPESGAGSTGGVAPGGDPGKQERAATGIPVVPSMDGFRAFAIGAIVVYHLILITGVPGDSFGRVAFFGTLPNMIDPLFIISGFVVFLPTVARGGEFGPISAYAVRRGARLLPAYWVAIVVTLLMLASWPSQPTPGGEIGAAGIAAHLGFLHMPALLVDYDFNLGFEVNGALWTLSMEVTFYVLLPLIAAAWFRRPLIGLLIAAAVTILWKEGLLHLGGVVDALGIEATPQQLASFGLAANNQFPAWAFSFGLGMTAAWAYVRAQQPDIRERVRRWAPTGQLLSLAAFGLAAYLIGRYALEPDVLVPHLTARRSPWISMFFSAAITALMLTTALAPPRLQRPFNLRSARALGDISYGMYLIHAPLALFLLALLPGLVDSLGGLLTMVLIATPLTVLYGWASARWLEQPIRRWARRYGRRAPAADASRPAPASAAPE